MPNAPFLLYVGDDRAQGERLAQVVEFYNLRFEMRLTSQEKADLMAFLTSL